MAKSSRIIDALKTNTSYSFYLRAKNSMGVWSDVSDVVAHITLKDTTAPTVLSSITLLLLSGVFQLKWAKPTTLDLRGGGYKVYVFTSNTVASAKLIREVGYTADSTEIFIGEKSQDASITIAAGTTYWWWVTTLDDSGNESAKVATTPASGSVTSGAAGTYYTVVTHNVDTILTNADLGKIHIMDVSGGHRTFTLPDTNASYIGYWIKLVRVGVANWLRVQAGATDVIWNSSVGGYIECDDTHDYSSVNLVEAAVGQWMTPEFGIWSSY